MGWNRYVALGDSFTEGIGDPRPHGRERGWADRVAETLAHDSADFEYANLAIRGRRLAGIVEEQVPQAVALRPDLISFAGGVNDALRRNWDLTAMAEILDNGLALLAGTGTSRTNLPAGTGAVSWTSGNTRSSTIPASGPRTVCI